MELNRRRKFYLILFHLILGGFAIYIPFLFKIFYVLLFIYAAIEISKKETNKIRIGHYYIAYFVGLELLIRISKAIVIDQFGKYGIILLILISFIKTRKIYDIQPKVFMLFIGLMLVSLILVDSATFRRDLDLISFYLSGPICLAFCVFYFNDLKMEFNKDFMNSLFLSFLPILSLVVFVFIKSGAIDIDSIAYGANSDQSGGFGPNQISVVFGYGMMILFTGFIFRRSITGYYFIDGFFLVILVYRILLTFSRGGFISPIISIIAAIIFISIRGKSFISSNKTAIFAILAGFVLVLFGWLRTNEITGNKLEERYEGYTGDTKYTDRREFTSGRDKLVELELDIFYNNWVLGVGPGMAGKVRSEKLRGGKSKVANHTEFSRMLAEHGLYGLFALIILITFPINKLRRSKNINNSFIIVLFVSLSMLTMSHNAHRLALPSFLYGFAFVNLIKDRKNDTVLR